VIPTFYDMVATSRDKLIARVKRGRKARREKADQPA